jgi:ketosteroid isomerase-like protein
MTSLFYVAVLAGGVAAMMLSGASVASPAEDAKTIADLDMRYQLAVKQNDAATMALILHDEFVLVLGDGRTASKNDLLKSASEQRFIYEQQDEEPGTQVVRVWGDTAVVTAKLWLKYTRDGQHDERKLWFSDTYVRTAGGWRYVFGQASLALPREP